MVVTIKTNTRRDAAWVEFECIKFGIESIYMQDNVVQITSPSLDKVQHISGRIGGTILAVTPTILFDPIGEV